MKFLSIVEDVFEITGRGCVVVPSLPRSSLDFRIKVQDSIQMRTPDGAVLDTHIAGIEMLCGPEVRDRMAFLLPKPITKSHVPKGTEIWLAREE